MYESWHGGVEKRTWIVEVGVERGEGGIHSTLNSVGVWTSRRNEQLRERGGEFVLVLHEKDDYLRRRRLGPWRTLKGWPLKPDRINTTEKRLGPVSNPLLKTESGWSYLLKSASVEAFSHLLIVLCVMNVINKISILIKLSPWECCVPGRFVLAFWNSCAWASGRGQYQQRRPFNMIAQTNTWLN